MGKKDRRSGDERAGEMGSPAKLISRRGWKIIGGGAATAVIGYIVLSFTDPRGQNWASFLSPFLILGGYGAIGYGIIAKERS